MRSSPRITSCGTPGQSFADEQARPESPPRLPPHPRRHRGPPDHGHGLPGRSPLPPGHHRDQHRQDRARATRPAGGHHQPQRPPPHCSAPAHPDRSRNPQIPQAPRTLRRQESGQIPTDPRALRRHESSLIITPKPDTNAASSQPGSRRLHAGHRLTSNTDTPPDSSQGTFKPQF